MKGIGEPVSAPESAVEDPPTKNLDNELRQVALYKKDKEEMDRLFGDSTSYARKVHEMLKVVRRERLIDKVRRAILGVSDTIEDAVSGITPESGHPPRKGKPPAERE
jgi:hypothetical protein